ncbi:hypothetical protein JD844_006311 [Phrynosoma platyrhinos]|uniref:Myb/SANT-like DNA-binding domain-containing protein n=1 Tax=Phrynosoma platyrhinos TaxID=52577 RepID=A0ABQ7T1A8_PHRPL|nr:hypothetical protein JD844_006311 [Phrynosoma platyrhinos]
MASSTPVDPQRKQGRGITWSHNEILELLSVWGDERIQRELNANHRNHNIYAELSAKLQDKGIHRSVPEIRNKCKTLKSEYSKVTNHNKISGNAPATCPFFNELDQFLRNDLSVFPKRITKSLHVVRQGPSGPSQHSSSQAPETTQHQDASMIALVTVEVPLAISEDDSVIIHLVPVQQPLPVDPPLVEESEPQDLPSLPAASDETQISGEGPQEEAIQSPAGETQATNQNESSDAPQEAAVRRVPVHTVVRRVRGAEELQDRRAHRPHHHRGLKEGGPAEPCSCKETTTILAPCTPE